MIKGISVSPGLAAGPVHVVGADAKAIPTWFVPRAEIDHEIERLQTALARSKSELGERQRIVAEETGTQDAEIFAVHRLVLEDPTTLGQVEERIREGINAEAALQAFIERLETTLGERLRGGIARSYANDITDPWRGVLDCLLREESKEVFSHGEQVVLAAAELTPKVVTMIERRQLIAVLCETGGRFSHGAVLARAFGIPCVVGLPNLLGRLEQGMMVTVDGRRGEVALRPDEDDLERFREREALEVARRAERVGGADEPAVTLDGCGFEVRVNIESLRDLEMFDPEHTDGIGLLRTEFLYMERPQFPSEEEQYRLYRRAVESMDGRPVILRTLDIGADKQLPYFKTPEEPNPALGWRGLRISLEWRDLLRVQMRAMLRAGFGHDLRILLPMVGSLQDIEAVHGIFSDVRQGLRDEGYRVADDVPVGVMIEVPSVLFILDEVLAAVDFVSVGTNDLVQYLLAVDRDNPRVARFYEPLHPAVLDALSRVATAANRAGVPCSVCGDIADDPAIAMLLLGMGFDGVSVAPNFLHEIKYAVRQGSGADARALAAACLEQSSPEGVRLLLERERSRIEG